MPDAYKVIKDVSLHQPLRKADELVDGTQILEVVGRTYAAGEYVLTDELTPRDQERAEDGDLDEFLEPASADEAEEAREQARRAGLYSTFTPEHEVERLALAEYGHEVTSREDVLAQMSSGAEDAKAAIEAGREDGADARPNITEQKTFEEVPSLVERSNEGTLTRRARPGTTSKPQTTTAAKPESKPPVQ